MRKLLNMLKKDDFRDNPKLGDGNRFTGGFFAAFFILEITPN